MAPTLRRAGSSALLTAFLLLAGLAGLRALSAGPGRSFPVDGWGVLLVVVAAASAGIRWQPLLSFALCTVTVAVYLLIGYPYGPILLSLVVASYGLARWERLRRAVSAAVLAVPVLVAHVFTTPVVIEDLWRLLPAAAWIIVPFSIGLARRLVVESAERQRAEAQRRVLDDERLRLASEVHDIVGHGLTAIRMQADIALHVRESRPEQAVVALTAISRASAEALTELRATLAAIAPEASAPEANAAEASAPERESRAPTPGLARIPDLCARMRESSMDVDLAVTGDQRAVATAVDVAAYRVVQESLTNAAKHATEKRARVEIGFEPDTVHVNVSSPASLSGAVREGFGITGMRRRVDAAGGALMVTAEAGEFRVHARLPGERPVGLRTEA